MPWADGSRETSNKNKEALQHNNRNRNSWALSLSRQSVRVLGVVSKLDGNLHQRIRYGQLGSLFCTSVGLTVFVVNTQFFEGTNLACIVLEGLLAIGFFFSMAAIFHKNISLLVTHRLLKEVNVLVILLSGFTIFFLDCAFPHHPFSPYLSFVYLSCVFLFVFMDSLKVKSRVFVLVCGALFAILTLYNVYTNTFSQGSGIIFRYGNGYSIARRTIVRSCFIQIFLFSINALYVMLIDKNMELMMNGSGYIYRDTGTGSRILPKDIEQENALGSG